MNFDSTLSNSIRIDSVNNLLGCAHVCHLKHTLINCYGDLVFPNTYVYVTVSKSLCN